MNAFVTWFMGVLLDWLAKVGVAFIKGQVNTAYKEAEIDKEVKAVKDAVTAADAAAKETGNVPPELEQALREAARKLNSNFISG
jgi:hypothetical protein